MIKPNKWLSDFFGREIVQAKVSVGDFSKIEQLQKQGFVLVEGEIEFELGLAEFEKFLQKITACEVAQMKDIAPLKQLVSQAFPNSRFRPPYFSIDERQRFYQSWIENAVTGKFDDICLVKRGNLGVIQGAITIRLESKQAKIGLLAVSAQFQRQGIAKELLSAAVLWAVQQNVETLKISTQISNLRAIRLYQHFGANVKEASYWFYPQ